MLLGFASNLNVRPHPKLEEVKNAMDLITHALLGAAIAPNKELAVSMAISGVIPDLWTILPLIEYLWTHHGRYRNQRFWRWIPPRYDKLTRWSHSVVPLGIAFVVGTYVLGISQWVFLPWAFHLIIDVPTHARSRTGFLLYPWSCWHPLGMRNWYDVWCISIVTILVLASVVAARFFH